MHLQLYLSYAVALLISARSTSGLPAPSETPFETFLAIGDTTLEHVQLLYDQLGGTFSTPFLLPDGTNVTVAGLELRLGNNTDAYNASYSDSESDADFVDSTEVSRLPQYKSTFTCAIPGQFGDQFVGPDVLYFFNVKLCSLVATLTPYTFAYAAIYVDKIPCGPVNKRICTGIYSVAAYQAGDTIGKKFQSYCQGILTQMRAACGDNGGTAVTTITGGGKFSEESFQTTETGDICPSPADEGGKVKCATMTCDGTCSSLATPAGTAHAKRSIASTMAAVPAIATAFPSVAK